MHSFLLTSIAFLCAFGGAAIGMTVRSRLPEKHLTRDSTDVIKLATGLMATLVALVLSLLISSANSSHSTIAGAYKHSLSGILELDKYLGAYGPETKDIRANLRLGVIRAFQQRWPGEDFGPPQPAMSEGDQLIDLERRLLALKPADSTQAWFQTQALQLAHGLSELRQEIHSQEVAGALPMPVLIVVLLCSVAIFGSFGLFVDPNPTVVTSLSMAALAVAAAIFLIVELNTPFDGLLQVPTAPARAVVAALGK
jgi:hypothetical protein